jgi:hypothetical protein
MLDECLALVHKLCFVHVDNCNFFFFDAGGSEMVGVIFSFLMLEAVRWSDVAHTQAMAHSQMEVHPNKRRTQHVQQKGHTPLSMP